MGMGLDVERPSTVAEFVAAAGDFLAAREAEHNLLFGLCDVIARHPEVYPECRFVVVREAGVVAAAALQTVPHNLILSSMPGHLAAAIADAVAPDLPGVLGPTDVARAFADRYTARTGRRGEVELRERIFRIDRVTPPRVAPGAWRFAEERDRALLAAWAEAFRTEALPELPPDDGGAIADRWLRRAGKTVYLWGDATGTPVSLAGAGGLTPRGIRIGPVYTPPALRGRGYASNLVAATTADQLASGRAFCFLFTDLANPTSNKIYQALGYQPVIDVDQYRFT
jgi:predicted GNAT family acetyltransferase